MWITEIWKETYCLKKPVEIDRDGSNIENSDQKLRSYW